MKKQPSPRRVIFVGAGLSAHLNYPLGPELVPKTIEYVDNQGTPEAAEVVGAVRRFCSKFLGTSSLEKVNVAEFYTVAQTLRKSPSLLEAPRRSRRLRH